MLQPFYKGGAYEKILNENVDSTLFDETFIVFEVDAIKENKKLFPIVTPIIMDVFLQKMRLKKNRKILVIKEALKAIASPLMSEYIKYLYKTARKFWASVGVVTQEIQDIIGSEIVKEAIINNSDVVKLLDQSKFKERFDEIRKILGLTDVDCKKIFTINRLENKDGRSFFREVFIRRGAVGNVFSVEELRECYMKSYGRIQDYSAVENIDRDNEEQTEDYDSRYSDEDFAMLDREAQARTEELLRLREMEDRIAEGAEKGEAMSPDSLNPIDYAENNNAAALAELERALAEARLKGHKGGCRFPRPPPSS